VQLVVVFVRLELRDLLLPVCIEDVTVVTRESLVDLKSSACAMVAMTYASAYILPGTGEQLRVRSVVLRGNLDQISAATSRQ
jgi:hypothetical protein